jgi:adenine/guanine/hypoxanthine permease
VYSVGVGGLDRWFGVTAAGSSLGVEARAGATTFLTMAYILFVNPQILSKAIHIEGADVPAELLTTTALAAALGSLVMGIWARYPFATAPGMGLNAYFAFTVVLGQSIPWQVALGAVFLNGVLVVLLSIGGAREALVNAMPESIRVGTSAGIGLFLAIIGLESAGIVVANPATLVSLGDLSKASVLLTLFGFFATAGLLAAGVRGAIMVGILATSAIAILTGAPVFQGQPFGGLTSGVFAAPVWPSHIALALDVRGATELGVLGIVFIFLFVDLFDTAGTFLGLAQKARIVDPGGQMPRASQAFTADALATVIGALLGTSSTTTYIESAAGVQEGGRTGLTAVVVALFFLASIFFWPIAGAIPGPATAPALIIVGAMMMSGLGSIAWDDHRVGIPAFLTMAAMPLTFSIANGISFGIISCSLIHLLSGRARSLHWLVHVLAVVLVARYVYLGSA